MAGSDVRIVLLGKTGVGKSSSGNTILGTEEFVEEFSPKSVTSQSRKRETMVSGRRVVVVDTPGLFDTSLTNEEMKEEIVKCMYMTVPGPHVFLLVIRLGTRFTQEEQMTMKWIQENFSKQALKYALVLFTGGTEAIDMEDYIEKSPELNELISECEGRFHTFDNKNKNRAQVTRLLTKIDKMVKANGGQHYTDKMYLEAQRKIQEEEKRKRREEEMKRQEEERKRQEEQSEKMEAMKKELERQGSQRHEEDMKWFEEENKRRSEEERKRRKEDRKEEERRREEDKKRSEEQDRKRLEEERKERKEWEMRREEDKKRSEEQDRKRHEEERKERKEWEMRREEDRKMSEEQDRKKKEEEKQERKEDERRREQRSEEQDRKRKEEEKQERKEYERRREDEKKRSEEQDRKRHEEERQDRIRWERCLERSLERRQEEKQSKGLFAKVEEAAGSFVGSVADVPGDLLGAVFKK